MRYLFNPLHYDLTDPSSIPSLLIQHMIIVGLSMLISIVIAIPLGLFVVRYRPAYLPTISGSSLLYTIPGLAMLAFLIPVTGLSLATIVVDVASGRSEPSAPAELPRGSAPCART